MYAKLNNGQVEIYPYTIGQLRKDNPNVSFPRILTDKDLAAFGLVNVQATVKPAEDHTKNFTVTVEEKNGKWVEKWLSTNATQAEVADRTETKAAQVRNERNDLLNGSDWTQLPDSPVNAQDWAAYRQALRNLPQQSGFPWGVSWPVKPE